MPTLTTITQYRQVQNAAKSTLQDLASTIGPDDTEESIAQRARDGLQQRGLRETWYHDCPAFVLLGSRSCLSISGRNYAPASEPVGATNLVTVDLSPKLGDVWGDCARSFCVEAGRVTTAPALPEMIEGVRFLERLHAAMPRFVTLATTFHQLHDWTHRAIAAAGFENLDFAGNAGHSIELRQEQRTYIEAGNHRKLVEVGFFTFEPHVKCSGGHWGFKHENIFFFGVTGSIELL